MVRELWSEALVVWGCPHINDLGKAITEDLEQRTSFAADVFVQGHAEETFVDLLNRVGTTEAVDSRGITRNWTRPPPVIKGKRGKFLYSPLVPCFSTFDPYRFPMTLPVQSSLVCAFGAFCTYPAMEGKPVQLSLQDTVLPIVNMAAKLGRHKCSGISFKDSPVTTKRLVSIADCVQGQVQWSACTKLSTSLSQAKTLKYLSDSGLATLEVGLESLVEETQRKIGKVHPRALFESFISQVSQRPDLSVVVSYMTGFPWENVEEASATLDVVQEIVSDYLGGNNPRGKVEHSVFELDRLSRMAQDPGRYNLRKENSRRGLGRLSLSTAEGVLRNPRRFLLTWKCLNLLRSLSISVDINKEIMNH